MMPQNILSTSPQYALLLPPDDLAISATLDYELGGVALQDSSQGLQVQVWTFTLDTSTGTVSVSAPSTGGPIVLFTQAGTTEISGTFDQNMNPCVAFMQAGVMNLWWYDPIAHAQVFRSFPGSYSHPHVAMDDKRALETLVGSNDMILAYMNGQTLCTRMQRDRWGMEYVQATIPTGLNFSKLGMNRGNRLQFEFTPS